MQLSALRAIPSPRTAPRRLAQPQTRLDLDFGPPTGFPTRPKDQCARLWLT